MSSEYSAYYKKQLENGQLFQDFIVDTCWTHLGLAIVQYGSRVYQQAVGESRTGVEIKHDMKFKETGNLWIEVSEKAKPRPGAYAESGIMRNDNSWLYVIGDYDKFFIFAKSLLVALSKSGRYKLYENGTKTSVGFLLCDADAEKYAAAVMTPNASKKVSSAISESEKIGRALYELAKNPPNQYSLFCDETSSPLRA